MNFIPVKLLLKKECLSHTFLVKGEFPHKSLLGLSARVSLEDPPSLCILPLTLRIKTFTFVSTYLLHLSKCKSISCSYNH